MSATFKCFLARGDAPDLAVEVDYTMTQDMPNIERVIDMDGDVIELTNGETESLEAMCHEDARRARQEAMFERAYEKYLDRQMF